MHMYWCMCTSSSCARSMGKLIGCAPDTAWMPICTIGRTPKDLIDGGLYQRDLAVQFASGATHRRASCALFAKALGAKTESAFMHLNKQFSWRASADIRTSKAARAVLASMANTSSPRLPVSQIAQSSVSLISTSAEVTKRMTRWASATTMPSQSISTEGGMRRWATAPPKRNQSRFSPQMAGSQDNVQTSSSVET